MIEIETATIDTDQEPVSSLSSGLPNIESKIDSISNDLINENKALRIENENLNKEFLERIDAKNNTIEVLKEIIDDVKKNNDTLQKEADANEYALRSLIKNIDAILEAVYGDLPIYQGSCTNLDYAEIYSKEVVSAIKRDKRTIKSLSIIISIMSLLIIIISVFGIVL